MTHCRDILTRNTRRPTFSTTRPTLPQHCYKHTTTYLYLIWYPVFLVLILTVVIPQVYVSPPRRSVPTISRFCPTLGWLHLVRSATHQVTALVTLPAPISLNLPDTWIRDEDNLLMQTIANTIRLNTFKLGFSVYIC